MLKTVTKTIRVEISILKGKGRFALELSSQLIHPNTGLVLMSFVAVSTLTKTHFHVFPPTPTWNLYLPILNLELFQHPLQFEHALFTWNIHPKFKQLLWGGTSS